MHCFSLTWKLVVKKGVCGDFIFSQEGYDSRYAVRDSAVILSLFLLRYDECGEVSLVDLAEILFGAGLAEFVQD